MYRDREQMVLQLFREEGFSIVKPFFVDNDENIEVWIGFEKDHFIVYTPQWGKPFKVFSFGKKVATVFHKSRKAVQQAFTDAGFDIANKHLTVKLPVPGMPIWCSVIGDAMVVHLPERQQSIQFICF